MKLTHNDTGAAPAGFTAPSNGNLMEGAPAGLPKVKSTMTTSVSERPHILTRRGQRWNRRAAH